MPVIDLSFLCNKMGAKIARYMFFDLQLGPRAPHKLEPPSVLFIHIPPGLVITVCYLDKLFFGPRILVLVGVILATKALVGFSYVLLRGMFGHWK